MEFLGGVLQSPVSCPSLVFPKWIDGRRLPPTDPRHTRMLLESIRSLWVIIPINRSHSKEVDDDDDDKQQFSCTSRSVVVDSSCGGLGY